MHGRVWTATREAGRRFAAGRIWAVQCAPHVALRLKRIFSKLGTHARNVYALSDTIDNARDLQWFLERYPLEIAAEDLAYLEKRAQEHRDQQELVARTLSRVGDRPAFKMALPPREYQRDAAALVLASGGLLLADDVGLGKTVSTICVFTDPRALPALVVAPTHLPRQWQRELGRFLPDLRTHVLRKTKPYDLTDVCKGKHRWIADEKARGGAVCSRCDTHRDDAYHGRVGVPDVIITSYSKLPGWAETLATFVQSVAFDEAQELRRNDNGRGEPTAKYASAQLVASTAKVRIALTATPVYNYGSEVFNVIDIVRPGDLGTFSEFRTEWCGGSYSADSTSINDPKAFGIYAREAGLMLRRTREDVGRELPELQDIVQPVEADLEQLDKLSDKCAELARFILGLGDSPLNLSPEAKQKGEKMLASQELSNRLRQATGIAKAVFVAEFVRMLVANGEKVLLFGWHRQVYSIWLEKLADLSPVLYTGSETAAQKDAAKEAFVSGDAQVLIMSLRSGTGVDGLQNVCRTVVYGELDWSPKIHTQATGRVHRDGQQHPVFAYYLMADAGIDPAIADVLGLKEAQSHGILNPTDDEVEPLAADGGDHVKLLAKKYLEQLGEKPKTPSTEAA